MEISNSRLEQLSQIGLSGVTSKEIKSMAAELLAYRVQNGETPPKCEGCKMPATTSDVEGVPLCKACAENCPHAHYCMCPGCVKVRSESAGPT